MASSATSHPASRSGNRGLPSNCNAERREKEYGTGPHNLDIYNVQELRESSQRQRCSGFGNRKSY